MNYPIGIDTETGERYCEQGCGCAYGTDDPSLLGCQCSGPCNTASDAQWYGTAR